MATISTAPTSALDLSQAELMAWLKERGEQNDQREIRRGR